MNEAITKFIKLGESCPDCGEKPVLRMEWPLDGQELPAIHWSCEHLTGDGSANTIKIAKLECGTTSLDDIYLLADVVRQRKTIDELPATDVKLVQYDVKEQIFNLIVLNLAQMYDINIMNHIAGTVFDFGTLWSEIMLKMPDDEIERIAATTEDVREGAALQLHCMVIDEMQKRDETIHG